MMTKKTFRVSVRIVIDPIENFNGNRIERDTSIRAKKNPGIFEWFQFYVISRMWKRFVGYETDLEPGIIGE